jgi:aminoglycoside phosphotransferase (APT) family kinase protein
LERFLEEKFGSPVVPLAMRHLPGGASRDTWTVELTVSEGPEAGRHALIIRRDLGGEIQPLALSREQEFKVLEVAFRAGVRVPRPRWYCTDPAVLGAPFLVMDRLEGESVGRRIVREAELAGARKLLPAQMGRELAAIHALPVTTLDFLYRPGPGQSAALSAVERSASQLWDLNEPHPALELGLRWLRARAPACPELVLVHSDYRVGNLMVGPEGLVGVIDWEFAHVGDPAEDLAWPCVRSWRFGRDDLVLGGVGQPEEFFAAYEQASGRAVDRAAVKFWEILGNLRWAIGCMAQAHRHLSGQQPSVEFASLGRKTAEVELELLQLIEQTN